VLGDDGVERFVTTPELHSEDAIGSVPLPPGQVWAISPGGVDENAGLYRIDVNVGPGSGVKIINVPPPGPFRETVRYTEGNLYARAKDLVGDKDPRQHEFTVQLRAFDAPKSGSFLGLPTLLALCSAMLGKGLAGGLVAAANSDLRAQTAQRALGRDGDQAHDQILRGYTGSATQGAGGLTSVAPIGLYGAAG
jgi:ATP-dependent Lon protease